MKQDVPITANLGDLGANTDQTEQCHYSWIKNVLTWLKAVLLWFNNINFEREDERCLSSSLSNTNIPTHINEPAHMCQVCSS